jgi:hypothetical protein
MQTSIDAALPRRTGMVVRAGLDYSSATAEQQQCACLGVLKFYL